MPKKNKPAPTPKHITITVEPPATTAQLAEAVSHLVRSANGMLLDYARLAKGDFQPDHREEYLKRKLSERWETMHQRRDQVTQLAQIAPAHLRRDILSNVASLSQLLDLPALQFSIGQESREQCKLTLSRLAALAIDAQEQEPFLDGIDTEILKAMAQSPAALKLVDLATWTDENGDLIATEKTCGEHVNRLIELGLAVRKEKRRGATITPKGRAALNRKSA